MNNKISHKKNHFSMTQFPPLGTSGALKTLIPSFLMILTVKEFWVMTNLSFIEFKHLSMMLMPCSSVISFI